ncbi:MAG: hypothetical protein ACT4NY_25560 [Pseudonocardiales bacterium]
MTVRFYGKGNPVDQCPAVFVDFENNRFLFQGNTVTDLATLAEATAHSPMLPTESVVALPPHMAAIILEAAREFLTANPIIVQRPVDCVGNPVGSCSAVFVDFKNNQILFQGNTVTDLATLAEITAHSPMLPTESVVALPLHMATIILEAAREFIAANADIVQRPVEGQPAVSTEAGAA